MTNYKEEQELEIEALQSLFIHENELDLRSPTHFCLKLLPFPEGDQENHVGVDFAVTYTAKYPEEAPKWEFEETKGLEEEQLAALKQVVKDTIDQSLGMAMVYSLAEAIQTYLRDHNKKQLSMHEQMLLRQGKGDGKADGKKKSKSPKKAAADSDDDDDDSDYVPGESSDEDSDGSDDSEEDGGTFRGLEDKPLCPASERVTLEQFNKWRNAFKKEMIDKGVWRNVDDDGRPSGRQLFERDATLATKDAEEGDMDADELAEIAKSNEAAKLHWGNEALFEGGDDDIELEDD